MGIFCMAQGTQTGALYHLEGWDGEEGDVCIPWLIHVDV